MKSSEDLSYRVVGFIRKHYGSEISEGWCRDPFKLLIGCVLSQRTREENTDAACNSLFAVARDPRGILRLPTQRLQKLIKPAGLTKQKASNIKRISKILLERYGGKVPRDRELLMELPGVGPKTADVTLCYAFGIPCIPVDTHVARISKRLGLVEENVRAEHIGEKLEKVFPRKDWRLINRGFVLFGRETCLPRNPRCSSCPLQVHCETGKRKVLSGSPLPNARCKRSMSCCWSVRLASVSRPCCSVWADGFRCFTAAASLEPWAWLRP